MSNDEKDDHTDDPKGRPEYSDRVPCTGGRASATIHDARIHLSEVVAAHYPRGEAKRAAHEQTNDSKRKNCSRAVRLPGNRLDWPGSLVALAFCDSSLQ